MLPSDAESLEIVEEMILGRAGESLVSEALQRHIRTRVTDEGLIIELFDLENAPLFLPDQDKPTQLLQDLMGIIASVAGLVHNGIAIEAHTRARPVVLADNPVWSLSTDRAKQARLMLRNGGLSYTRVRRITGHADRDPVVENRLAVRNNRIKVILLRSDI